MMPVQHTFNYILAIIPSNIYTWCKLNHSRAPCPAFF